MARIRTFVALELTDAVRRRAADLIERLRESQVKVTWVPPDKMHVTLKFLGDVQEQRLAEVCNTVADVCRSVRPFELQCGGAGAFPNVQRPRTVWLGVREGEAELNALQEAIEDALGRIGFRKERRRFHGHLTLGRVRGTGPELETLGGLLRQYADFQTPRITATEVRVLASYLEKSGATYEVLGTCPLDGAGRSVDVEFQ